MATGRNDFHAVKENSHPTPSVTAMSVNMMASSMLLNFDEGIVLTVQERGWHALTRTAASKLSEPSFRILGSEALGERCQMRRHTVAPRPPMVFISPRVPEWMATRDRAAARGFHSTRSRAHLRDQLTVLRSWSRSKGLQPPVEHAVHCCHGQYSQSIHTALPTTIAPVLEHGVTPSKISACPNIDREATSDEPLAAFTIPPLVAQPPLSGDTALPWRAFW
nr:uncharacterized protein LOC126530934 isoform X1 [Dermacentor andersoni]